MNKNQILFSGFDRLGNFPLDPTNYYETKEDLEAYLETGIVYPGQRFTVYNDPDNNGLYILISNKKLIKLADAETVQSEVDTLKAKDSTLDSLLSEMSTTISQHQGAITTNVENIISIRGTSSKSISDLESTIKEKITSLDDKFEREITSYKTATKDKIDKINNDLNDTDRKLTNKINLVKEHYIAADSEINQKITDINTEISDIKNQITLIPKFGYEPVNELPVSDIKEDKIYLLKSSDQTSNNFEEYLYINGKWEKIGNREVDFTGYATETWTDNKFYNKTEVDEKINTVNNNINNTNLEISNLETKINGDFETVNSKFEEQYALNATIEESITKLNLNSSNVIESNIKIGETVAEVNERVSDLVSEDVAIKSSISGLKNADIILEGKIVEIDERVTAALNGFEAGTEAEVSDITKRLNALTNTDNEIKDEIAALKNTDSSIDSSITTINNSLLALSNQDTTLDGRISELESAVETEINTLKNSDIEINNRLTSFEETTNKEITNLKNSDITLSGDISGIKGNVTAINNEIDSLKTKDSSIDNEISDLKSENESLKNRLLVVEALLTRIADSIEVNEDGTLTSIDQENKIPTVKAVVDLLKQYNFNPGTPDNPPDNSSSGDVGENENLKLRNFSIIDSEDGKGLVLSGVTVNTEIQELIIK